MAGYEDGIEALRAAARPDRPAPDAARDYLEKVRTAAITITDADVDGLRAAGIAEDEIFELTVAAAVASGLERLEAGLRALG